MKVQVIHDEEGRITSVGLASTAMQGKVRLRPNAEEFVTEVEVPDIDEKDHEQLAKLAQKYRLDRSSKSPKLVPL